MELENISDEKINSLGDNAMDITSPPKKIHIKDIKPLEINLYTREDNFVLKLKLFEDVNTNIDVQNIVNEFIQTSKYTYEFISIEQTSNPLDFYIIFEWEKEANNIEDVIESILQAFAPSYNELLKRLKQQTQKQTELAIKREHAPIQKWFMNTSKVFNDKKLNLEWQRIRKDKKYDVEVHNKKQLEQKVHIILKSDDKYLKQCFFNPFDRIVYDEICTLFFNGNKTFSLAQLVSAIYKQSSKHINKNQKEKVKNSINKMRVQIVDIDFSEQVKNKEVYYNNEKIKNYYQETYLLAIKKEKIKTENNKVVEGYTLLEPPVLFLYAYINKQFTCVNQKINKALVGKVSMTENNLIIDRYLKLRIVRMKNKKTNSNKTIQYSAVCEQIEIQNNQLLQKAQKQRIRKTIHEILNAYKKENFIKDYEPYKKNQSYFIGIRIGL